MPVEARQVVIPMKPSAGQLPEVPVQVSATSHGPATPRHVVVFEANPSTGHAAMPATQVSATSHIPEEGRHTPPAIAGIRPRQRPVTAPVAALRHD